MMHARFLWVPPALAVVSILVFYFMPRTENYVPDTTTRHQLTIATPATPAPGLVFVAHEGGLFHEAGLDVTIKKYSSGKASLDAMLKGETMVAATSENPFMRAVLRGENALLFASIMSTDRNYAIVARNDRGISQVSDLAGKRMGVTRGTNSEFLLEAMLTLHRIDKDQVTIVDKSPTDIVDAIVNKDVDAISTWNPHLIGARKRLGDNHSVFYGSELYTATFNLVTMNELIETHPEIVDRVIYALSGAANLVRDEPERARDMIAANIRLSRAHFDELWDIFNYEVSLNQALISTMESQARWVHSKSNSEDIEQAPNFIDSIYLDALKRVNPSAVTIIH